VKLPPEPTSADLGKWRRLSRVAIAMAANPAAPAGDLQAAAKAAKTARVIGVLNRENECVQLVRTARQFVECTAAGRRDLAPRLGAVAQAVRARLEALAAPQAAAPPDPPREPRFRADLDG